jgi:hypothetical protein
MSLQTIAPPELHPQIQAALDNVELPEVQELIRKVSTYGLAVALPHMHDENGGFTPLPKDQIAFESRLNMSFPKRTDPLLAGSIPVMWRWDGELHTAATCATCDRYPHNLGDE